MAPSGLEVPDRAGFLEEKAKEPSLALTSCLNPKSMLAFGAEGLSP